MGQTTVLIKHDELWCCDAVLHVLSYKRVKENLKTKILIFMPDTLFSKEKILEVQYAKTHSQFFCMLFLCRSHFQLNMFIPRH